MIQPPIYIEPGMGSWLSSLKNKVVGVVAGKGNTPGTPTTRKYGYDPDAVAKAVAANILAQQNAPQGLTQNQKTLIAAGASVALILLLSGGRRRGR
jgi:hypothetical protein